MVIVLSLRKHPQPIVGRTIQVCTWLPDTR